MTWLTDEQIEQIIANASADDIIEALVLFPNVADAPLQVSREIFNRSADRLGLSNGATAAQMIPAHRFTEWTQKVRQLIARESPLPEATDLSPDSVDSGA